MGLRNEKFKQCCIYQQLSRLMKICGKFRKFNLLLFIWHQTCIPFRRIRIHEIFIELYGISSKIIYVKTFCWFGKLIRSIQGDYNAHFIGTVPIYLINCTLYYVIDSKLNKLLFIDIDSDIRKWCIGKGSIAQKKD